MKNIVLILLLLTMFTGCTSTEKADSNPPENNTTAEELAKDITQKHPVTYIKLAAKLMEGGQKDEAVVWYYVGQMRYRAHLMANPNLEPSGDPALYSSLKYVVGTPINEYAGSNVDNWAKLIAEAIEWNASNENSFTPKEQYPEIYEKIENNFNEFRSYVIQNKESIIQQRKDNGLSNN